MTEKAAIPRSTLALNGKKIDTSVVVSKPIRPAKRKGPNEEKSYCAVS
jgi:hypothetical protein